MSCCGKRESGTYIGMAPTQERPRGPVLFEYVGRTRLTVFGRATGARYRFDQFGGRVYVDPRDAPALALVANLRRVTSNDSAASSRPGLPASPEK